MSLHFHITGDNSDIKKKLQQTRDEIQQTAREIEAGGNSIDGFFDKLKGLSLAIGGAFAVQGLSDFVSQVARVRGEFQQLEIAFTTMLGSRAEADELMRQISETAAKTPFDLQGVADGAKQLLSYGVASDEVIGTLTKLGDIASGLSIPLNDLVYLYGTTITQGRMFTQDLRQFQGRGIPIADELAKQFGVAKSEIGDLVSAGKVGAEEFRKAIDSMAKGQFNNLMEEQSKSITGQISNLEDQVSQMFNEIGKSSEGVISSVLSGAGVILEHYKEIGLAIGALVAGYGAYKAAQMVHIAVTKLQIAAEATHSTLIQKTALSIIAENAALGVNLTVTQATAIAEARLGTAKMATASRTVLLTSVIKANTMALLAQGKALLTNPYVLVGAAVAGLVYAVYKHSTALTAAERAQESFNASQKEYKETAEQSRQAIEGLVRTMQSSTATELQKAKAWDELKRKAPELAQAFGRVGIATAELADVQKKLGEEEDRQAKDNIANNIDRLKKELNSLNIQLASSTDAGWSSAIAEKIQETTEELKKYEHELSNIHRLEAEAREAAKDPIVVVKEARVKYDKAKADLDRIEAIFEEEKRKFEGNVWRINPQIVMDKAVLQAQVEKAHLALQNAQARVQGAQIKTVSQEVERISKQIAENNKQIAEARKPGSRADASLIKKLQEDNKALEAQRELYAPTEKKTTSSKDPAKERQRQREAEARLRELARKQEIDEQKRLLDIELALEEQAIALIEDGGERKRASLAHSHRKQIIELERQKQELLEKARERARALFEQDPKNEGKIFDPSSVSLGAEDSIYHQQRSTLLERQQAQEREALRREELQAMRQYLREYGTIEEQRQAIIDEAKAKLESATTEGERLSIQAKLRIDLGNFDAEMNKLGSTIGRMFGDLSQHGQRALEELSREAQDLRQYLQAGVWEQVGDTGRDRHGLTKEHFGNLAESPKELKELSDQTELLRDKALEASGAFNQVAQGVKDLFNAGDNPQKLEKALGSINAGLSKISGGLSFVSSTFSELADATGSDALKGLADGINIANDAMAKAQQGMQAGAMFGPVGAAIGGVVGGVTSLIGSFAKMKDAKHEREIQRLQRQVEGLDRAYKTLGRGIDQAYSHDASGLISQQETMLRQKQALIRLQIREEQDKKKTDHSKIRAWEAEIENINDTIEDNRRKAKDAIFGSDVKSAINDFANAYAEAWAKGNDRAESAKDFVKKQIRAMVMEAIKAKTSKPMEAIREKMREFFSDGIMSASEQSTIDRMALDLTRKLDGMMTEQTQKYLQDTTHESISGSSRGFQTMSQETASELNGRFTAIQQDLRLVVGTTAEVRNIQLLQLGHLEAISQNTRQLHEMNERLGTIERNTRTLR